MLITLPAIAKTTFSLMEMLAVVSPLLTSDILVLTVAYRSYRININEQPSRNRSPPPNKKSPLSVENSIKSVGRKMIY